MLLHLFLLVRSSKERVIKVQIIVVAAVTVGMVDLQLVMCLMVLLMVLLMILLILLLMLIEFLWGWDKDWDPDLLHDWVWMGNFFFHDFLNGIRHLDFFVLHDRIGLWHLDLFDNLHWIWNLEKGIVNSKDSQKLILVFRCYFGDVF